MFIFSIITEKIECLFNNILEISNDRMPITVCLTCISKKVRHSLPEFFKKTSMEGIYGPQGQIVRMHKYAKIRWWSCGREDVIEMGVKDALELSTWSGYHKGKIPFDLTLLRVLRDAKDLVADQIIILADKNGQIGWERDECVLEMVYRSKCMVHIVEILKGKAMYSNENVLLEQINENIFAIDIWRYAPKWSCKVILADINGEWTSIQQGFAPIQQFIK